MELDTALAQDEKVSQEYKFSYALFLFFLKTHFWLTNKRLIINAPNVFLFIPTGKNTVTYPLRNIGGVQTKTEFKFWNLVGGVILLLIGLKAFWLLALLGVILIVSAFQTVISLGATGGAFARYYYLPWEATSAKKMINELNQLIANI